MLISSSSDGNAQLCLEIHYPTALFNVGSPARQSSLEITLLRQLIRILSSNRCFHYPEEKDYFHYLQCYNLDAPSPPEKAVELE